MRFNFSLNIYQIAAIIILTTSAGCSTVSVYTDYDESADFTKYKEYCWCYHNVIPGDKLPLFPLIKKRVIAAVDMVMKSKGFSIADNSNADFFISVHAATKDKTKIQHSGPMFYDPYWGAVGGHLSIDDYTEGTLYIDIIDAKTRNMIWRGVGTEVVKEYQNGNQMQQTINKMVKEILKDFPPLKK